MKEIITTGIQALMGGGPEAIVFGLIIVIVLILVDRQRLLSSLSKKDKLIGKKDEKIDQIIEDYYRGNMTLADALNQLRNVLTDIKSKIL